MFNFISLLFQCGYNRYTYKELKYPMQSVVSAFRAAKYLAFSCILTWNATRVCIRKNRGKGGKGKNGDRGCDALERRWAFTFLGNVKRHYVPNPRLAPLDITEALFLFYYFAILYYNSSDC